MASTYVPPMWRRSLESPLGRYAASTERGAYASDERGSYPLLVLVAVVFVISAGALLLSQSGLFSWTTASSAPATVSAPAPAVVTPLAPAELQNVLSYARTMRTDDPLVQVRPGVFAKKSNVEGVQIAGRTVFYDLVPHQSYGPLGSGKIKKSQMDVLARDTDAGALILVYVKK